MPLDLFYEETILHDFENRFLIGTFYEKKMFEAARLVLGLFLDMYDLHGVLDASRYQMTHRRWKDRRPFWSDCHKISWWPMARPSVKRS